MAKTPIFSYTDLSKNPNLIEAKFFEAMRNGYVSGKTPSQLKDKSFCIQYVKGLWRVTDRWDVGVLPCINVSGETRIFYDNIQVWVMQYFGAYAQKVIPFLKGALLENYQKNIFLGGRGPQEYTSENLTYQNKIDAGSSFHNFRGEERIFHDEHLMGEHRYQGGLLI